MLLIGIYSSDSTATSATVDAPAISKQAMEIHAFVSPQIDMTLEDIQKSLDSAVATKASGALKCTLGCNPVNCCFTQQHLDRMIFSFGCCIGEEGNDCGLYGCLDLNGDNCITAADLSILLQNWCVD